MKLVEKKCPNCGASLSFNSTDKEVTCNYCKVSFEIERDVEDLIDKEKIAKMANDMLDPESFNLHKKTIKRFGSVFIIIWMFTFFFIFFMFIFMASRIIPRIGG